MERINNNKYFLLSFVLIIVLFHLSYGISIVIPANINWLMSVYHDWGQHYLGWVYFLDEPWHFPIGYIENFNYPAGTNIGYTDSIPLLAIFFKIFSFLLPNTFQYFGIWLLVCHLLMGYYTFKILNLFTKNSLLIVLSVLFMSFNPVLMYRAMHFALCAQWLIVASIYYYLIKTTAENVDVINKKQIIILLLSALINPYLFFMVFGFNIILPFKNYFFDKFISLKRLVFYIISAVLLVILSWYIIGMVSFNGNTSMEVANSYGLYGFNLNSFYNSSGWSSVFQQYKTYAPQQYEGYSYLGLGAFILIFLGVFYLGFLYLKNKFVIKKYYKLFPLIILIIAFTLFAITNKVTINDTLLLEFKLPDLIIKVGNIFRASGRFIWVLYYTIFLFFLVVYSKIKISEKGKVLLLLIIVSVQFYDIKLFFNKNLPSGNYEIKPLNEEKWIAISSKFDKIITYPPHDNNLLYSSDYQDWCYIALVNNLPITCGYVARESGDTNLIFQKKLKKDIEDGIIGINYLYVTIPEYIEDFSALIYKKQVNFGYLDGYYYLYSRENGKMANHKFTLLELHKKDSIYIKIKKLIRMETIAKPNVEKDKIQFNIEKNTINNDILAIEGWAFLKDGKSKLNDSIFIVLESANKTHLAKTVIKERPDLIEHFENDNLKNTGFNATIFTDALEDTEYNLLIGIKSDDVFTFESLNQPIITINKEFPPQKLSELPYESQKEIIYNVEEIKEELENIYINGWAFLSNQTSLNSTIEVILENDKGSSYAIKTLSKQRPDVTSYFKSDYNYDNAGFTAKVKKESLTNGIYKIGILITNSLKSKDYKLTDKALEIKN